MIIGAIGYWTTHGYVNNAIERNVRIRSTVIARTLEQFLDNRIRDISLLNLSRINRESLLEFVRRQIKIDPDLV